MPLRRVEVERRVYARNEAVAERVRERRRATGTRMIDVISSPGAGKTTLLERTLDRLDGQMSIALVAGDVRTTADAERLARRTNRLVQAVETGGACHLDARQIEAALDSIDLADTDLVIVENVGNLVCPAGFDLGEDAKIVLLSVTEGDDKPDKYPAAFARAAMLVITKADLLPHVEFDVGRAVAGARAANRGLESLVVSATTGEGLEAWIDHVGSIVGAGARLAP